MPQQPMTVSTLSSTSSPSFPNTDRIFSSSQESPTQASTFPTWQCWSIHTTLSDKAPRSISKPFLWAMEWWTSRLFLSVPTSTWSIGLSSIQIFHISSIDLARQIENLLGATTSKSSTKRALRNSIPTVMFHLFRRIQLLLLQWLFWSHSQDRKEEIYFSRKHLERYQKRVYQE